MKKPSKSTRFIPIILSLILVMVVGLSGCVTINPPATTEPAQAPTTTPTPTLTPTPTATPASTPTQEPPLPRIEAFIADPNYNPGNGLQLARLSNAKIFIDTDGNNDTGRHIIKQVLL